MEYIFETDNLYVRQFYSSDAKRLYEYHLDPKVKQWMPNESYEDIAEAEEAIDFFSDCVEKDQLPYVLAVVSKQTGELIGDTGINEVEGKPDEVEIGYVISDDYSGKGLATELVKAMTSYVISKFGTKVLFGRVMHGNDASVRVLEKNGYTFMDEEFGAEDDPYGNGMLVYAYRKLYLRTVNDEDVNEVAKTWPSDHSPLSEDEAKGVIANMQGNYVKNKKGCIYHLCLAVCRGSDPGVIMGWCGLDGTRNQTEPELFIILCDEYQNKGYGTWCAKELLRMAVDDFALQSVHGGCAKDNIASWKAMEKAGMIQYGTQDNGDPVFRFYANK